MTNLCDNCIFEFATCNSNPQFACQLPSGNTNDDTVIACHVYVPRCIVIKE